MKQTTRHVGILLVCGLALGGAACGGDNTSSSSGTDDGGTEASSGSSGRGFSGSSGAGGGTGAGGASGASAATGVSGITSGSSGSVDGGREASDAGTADSTVPDTGVDMSDAQSAPDTSSTDASMGNDALTDAGVMVPDAPIDAVTADAAVDGPVDSGRSGGDTGTDAGADAGGSCGADNSSCSNTNNTNGLCKSAVCSSCVDTVDDGHCATAYAGKFLCLGGACAPGDCRANTDCASNANGSLCSVSTPNFCGKCSADPQCAGANPLKPICNVSTGACVAAACTAGTPTMPAVCSANPSDVCCGTSCTPGDCCPGDNAYCTSHFGAGATCQGHTCSKCDAIANFTYFVDPANGNDSTATGSGTTANVASPGCAFKTIARALQAIGAPTGANAATIVVRGPATVANGETFPISVPAFVTITTALGAVTVQSPAGKAAFALNAPNSKLLGTAAASLVIDGSGNTASNGVVAGFGSTASTTIQDLTVQNFLGDGILVFNGGALTINKGVVSATNGLTTNRHSGLHVRGTGQAFVTVPAGSTPTLFKNNTEHGVLVDGSASITVTGAVTSAIEGTGTVVAQGNFFAGLWIQQTPATTPPPPQNVITGFVSFANTAGNGMLFRAGSNVKIRRSVSLGNPNGSGVNVSFLQNGAAVVNDISKIDLGNATGPDYGHNVFQGSGLSGAAKNNGAVGICLNLKPNSGTLMAAGNTFSGAVDCSTTAGVVTINKGGCGNSGNCAGGICDLGLPGVGNAIDVSQCTHP